MRWPRFGGLRRLATTGFILVSVWALLAFWLLPYNSPVLLWIRFVSQKLLLAFRTERTSRNWVSQPLEYPVDLAKDVALIIKTGYGTRARVPAQLDALALPTGSDGYRNTIIIGDFASEISHRGIPVIVHDVVHDVVTTITQHNSLPDEPGYERVVKYKDMTDAILSGKVKEAEAKAKTIGWEIDAMKVCKSSIYTTVYSPLLAQLPPPQKMLTLST